MAIKLYKSGDSTPILVMDTVQTITFNVKGNVMDIPIPDEPNAMIMNMGGVSRSIKLNWTLVSQDVVGDIAKLAFNILDGTMFNDFKIEIEQWGLKKDCVIASISITQRAGEVSKFDVSIDILIGDTLL